MDCAGGEPGRSRSTNLGQMCAHRDDALVECADLSDRLVEQIAGRMKWILTGLRLRGGQPAHKRPGGWSVAPLRSDQAGFER